jgi:hypothetical protein
MPFFSQDMIAFPVNATILRNNSEMKKLKVTCLLKEKRRWGNGDLQQ